MADMDNDREKLIRERAYQIWTDEGRPEGRADAHWEQAEKENAAEDKHGLISERTDTLTNPFEKLKNE
jgi:hypothetical protein